MYTMGTQRNDALVIEEQLPDLAILGRMRLERGIWL